MLTFASPFRVPQIKELRFLSALGIPPKSTPYTVWRRSSRISVGSGTFLGFTV